MTETIINIDINKDLVMAPRSVNHKNEVRSIDIDQTSGKYAVTSPRDENGVVGGNVIIYPQSPQLSDINIPVVLKNFRQVSSLHGPYDSRFDYVRRKLWIADTGNDRVLKVNIDTEEVETIISNIIYPHAMAANVNRGGVFVKAYSAYESTGVIYRFSSNGTERSKYEYTLLDDFSSSSSSEGSSPDTIPPLPFASSIVFDHVRSRVWWVDDSNVYMVDERNLQVQVYDLAANDTGSLRAIDVELSTGNVFIVGRPISSAIEWVIAQISRDNNKFLGRAYIAS